LLIRNLTIVDPETRTSRRGNLKVDDGRFVTPARAEGDGVDGSDTFALPGLIDAHVHVVPFPPGPGPFASLIVERALASLREALQAGVTTVRDLGCDLATALAAREIATQTAACLSRLLVAGPMLSVPNGHGTGSCHGLALSNADEAVAMTRVLSRAGVDVIKVVTAGANGRHQMPRDLMRAVMNEARAAGLPVAVHAHLQLDQIVASVELGAKTIEHGFLLHQAPETVERMRAHGVSLCPTLRVVEAVREDPDWHGQRLVPGAWEDALTSVRVAAEAGVSIIAGTDAGVFGVGFGDAWREVSLIGEQTGSRWEGIRAATCNAATAVGRGDLGSFRVGGSADAVFLRRDPVTVPVDRSDVVAVMRDGQIVHGELP